MNSAEEEEFRQYVVAKMDDLRGLAYLACGNWQTAEDAVSTGLTKLYVHGKRVTTPHAYACRVVINAVVDESRRPWRRREQPAGPELLDRSLPDHTEAYGDRVHLQAALRRLPPGQRAVLVLRFYADFSVDEVAEILHKSPGTIKSQTARGLAGLENSWPRRAWPSTSRGVTTMSTDLRQLFRTVDEQLPPAPYGVEEITRRGRTRRRRRTTAQLGGIAAAVVAVTGVALLVPHPRPASEVPVAAAQPFTATIRPYKVGDLAVQATGEVTPGYQSASILRPNGVNVVDAFGARNVVGVLTVYRPGVFSPADYSPGGTPVTVDGRPGFARTVERPESAPHPHPAPGAASAVMLRQPSVAWQYADDAWATVTAAGENDKMGMTAAEVRAVADKFVPHSAGSAVTAPYTLAVPAGWQVASAGGDEVSRPSFGTGPSRMSTWPAPGSASPG